MVFPHARGGRDSASLQANYEPAQNEDREAELRCDFATADLFLCAERINATNKKFDSLFST